MKEITYQLSENYVSRLRLSNGKILCRVQHEVFIVVRIKEIFWEKVSCLDGVDVSKVSRRDEMRRLMTWVLLLSFYLIWVIAGRTGTQGTLAERLLSFGKVRRFSGIFFFLPAPQVCTPVIRHLPSIRHGRFSLDLARNPGRMMWCLTWISGMTCNSWISVFMM